MRADNPGPYTLSGTNTWVVGRDPAWVIDPGPELAEHLDAVVAEVEARGGAGGIAVTHDHLDHVEGVLALRERLGRPPVAARALRRRRAARRGRALRPAGRRAPCPATRRTTSGSCSAAPASPATPCSGRAACSSPTTSRATSTRSSACAALPLEVICPGHGPPVWEPRAKLEEYIAHRRERERRLLAALDDGLREEDELLDAVWDDAPAALRPAAAVTLGAHREKLQAEGRWPRPGDGTPAP